MQRVARPDWFVPAVHVPDFEKKCVFSCKKFAKSLHNIK